MRLLGWPVTFIAGWILVCWTAISLLLPYVDQPAPTDCGESCAMGTQMATYFLSVTGTAWLVVTAIAAWLWHWLSAGDRGERRQ